ncbi:MAG: 50S ribosomal protein L9 [Chlamydiia bacterium]|nr:50S ribosomal protein L9 [Chlamydiia bacterium]
MKQPTQKKTELLLLEDVRNLGRKGELASAKPGFIRNYLLPQKKAVIADNRTIRMQEKLLEERAKQAVVDKKESEELAAKLKEKTFSTLVKNDSQGHLYGSVTVADIVKILEEQEGINIDRKHVIMPKPIKSLGVFEVELRLKEDIPATFKLKVEGETKVEAPKTRAEVIEEGEETLAAEGDSVEGEGEDLPIRSEREKEMKEELEERTKE